MAGRSRSRFRSRSGGQPAQGFRPLRLLSIAAGFCLIRRTDCVTAALAVSWRPRMLCAVAATQDTACMRAQLGRCNRVNGAHTTSSRVQFTLHEHSDVGVRILSFPCPTPQPFPMAVEREPKNENPGAHPGTPGQGLCPRRGYPRLSVALPDQVRRHALPSRVIPLPRRTPPPPRPRARAGSHQGKGCGNATESRTESVQQEEPQRRCAKRDLYWQAEPVGQSVRDRQRWHARRSNRKI